MNPNKPLLSISIPTKNRQYYCMEAIKHILSYNNQDFELCIHDHSDDRTIEEFISTVEDKRLKYIYTTEAISSSENMSRSIQMTNGEYVCMIGDDDTVLPNIFKWVKYMKENDIDSICPGYIPQYIWPNKEIKNSATLNIIKYRNKKDFQRFNVMNRVKELFEEGIINYQAYFLPRVYHGIIKKNLLNKIYNEIETYFGGLSPDIYSTVALSKFVKNHIVINQAISIAGACPQSTTSQNITGEHKGELSNAPHLKYRKEYIWDELIPSFYSVETIWAESALSAARDFKMNDMINSFNKERFYYTSLAKNKDISNLVISKLKLIKDIKFNKTKYKFMSFVITFEDLIRRIILKILKKQTNKYTNIKNISLCVEKCIKDIKIDS